MRREGAVSRSCSAGSSSAARTACGGAFQESRSTLMDEEYERANQAQRDRQKAAEEHKDRVNTEKKLVKVNT